jgi:hypothetical protein
MEYSLNRNPESKKILVKPATRLMIMTEDTTFLREIERKAFFMNIVSINNSDY